MTNLPRTTIAAILGASILSTLSIGAAIGPARAEAAMSKPAGCSSNITVAAPAPLRM